MGNLEQGMPKYCFKTRSCHLQCTMGRFALGTVKLSIKIKMSDVRQRENRIESILQYTSMELYEMRDPAALANKGVKAHACYEVALNQNCSSGCHQIIGAK